MSILKILTKGYQNHDALERVIKYDLRIDDEENDVYWDAMGVDDSSYKYAIKDMRYIKAIYNKMHGKQLWHIVISIKRYKYIRNKSEYEDKISHEESCCKMIGMQVSDLIYRKGFQNLYAIHEDSDYLHLHIVVNSVSYLNGYKLTDSYAWGAEIYTFLNTWYPELQWQGIYYQ